MSLEGPYCALLDALAGLEWLCCCLLLGLSPCSSWGEVPPCSQGCFPRDAPRGNRSGLESYGRSGWWDSPVRRVRVDVFVWNQKFVVRRSGVEQALGTISSDPSLYERELKRVIDSFLSVQLSQLLGCRDCPISACIFLCLCILVSFLPTKPLPLPCTLIHLSIFPSFLSLSSCGYFSTPLSC